MGVALKMTKTIGGQNYYDFEKDCRISYSAHYSNAYDFWDDSCEDIYTLEDGEAIENK